MSYTLELIVDLDTFIKNYEKDYFSNSYFFGLYYNLCDDNGDKKIKRMLKTTSASYKLIQVLRIHSFFHLFLDSIKLCLQVARLFLLDLVPYQIGWLYKQVTVLQCRIFEFSVDNGYPCHAVHFVLKNGTECHADVLPCRSRRLPVDCYRGKLHRLQKLAGLMTCEYGFLN